MPRPCPALTMPFFSRPRHSTAVERRSVGYLPAFDFFRLPRRVPRRLLSEAHHSSSQWSIPTTVKSCSSTLQKRRYVKLLEKQFGYFQLPCGLSRRTRYCRSRAGARHVMCELTNDMAGERHGNSMGAAWTRHAMCESAFMDPWNICMYVRMYVCIYVWSIS
jgi:hypothetical protein